jgi:hypothetical protein
VNRLVLIAQKHFPRCLERYVTTAHLELPPSWNASDVDFVASFDLGCYCGNKKLHVIGIPDEELGLYSPIRTQCSACGNEELLFDLTKHGYDAEFGHITGYQTIEGEMRPLECSSCGDTSFSVQPWFTYQFEPDDLSDVASINLSNYFDGFGIDLICDKCKTVNYIGQFECS